jgi:pimeloyl-ACP methyl ester carboxylesterase
MRNRWIVLVLAALAAPALGQNDSLPRHAEWGGRFEAPGAGRAGVRIRALEPGSALARAGFVVDDLLVRADGRGLDAVGWDTVYFGARGGDVVRIEADRGGRRIEQRVTLPAAAAEAWAGVETQNRSVLSERGLRHQLLITRPSGATGRVPAILFVPWLSCDAVEGNGAGLPRDVTVQVLHTVATRSGWALARIEKPGVGDSEGVCPEADFATEHAGHRAALDFVRAHPWVDPQRIVLMGHSYGGGILPLVAQGSKAGDAGIIGYVFLNSWVGTWHERLLAFERLRLERSDRPPGEATEELRALTAIYAEYLLGGRTPGEVLAERPELRRYWDDGDRHQYGRPAAFYQQIQALNLAAAWEKARAPVLAIWGENDLVMHRAEHERVVAWANRRAPGSGTLVTVPGMDHSLGVVEGGVRKGSERAAAAILEWLAARARG